MLEAEGDGPPTVDDATGTVSVAVSNGPARLAGVVRRLDEAEVAIADIGLRQPTLDEVFPVADRASGRERAGRRTHGSGLMVVSMEALRVEARHAPGDILQLWKRNMLAYRRQPDLLVFSTIQPVMFVLLFAYVFGGAIQTGPVDYIDFCCRGSWRSRCCSGRRRRGGTGGGRDERNDRSLSDAADGAVGGGGGSDPGRYDAERVCGGADAGRGFLIGFRYHGTVAGAIAMPFVAVLFGQTFCWISAAIGTSVRRAETAQVASFVWLFPLVFVSSVFVPVETMPDWLEVVAENSPVTHTVNAMRGLALGTDFWEPLVKALAWMAGIMAVFVPLAVWRYRSIQ